MSLISIINCLKFGNKLTKVFNKSFCSRLSSSKSSLLIPRTSILKILLASNSPESILLLISCKDSAFKFNKIISKGDDVDFSEEVCGLEKRWL